MKVTLIAPLQPLLFDRMENAKKIVLCEDSFVKKKKKNIAKGKIAFKLNNLS